MDLYIANTTKQHHVFAYNHPEGDPDAWDKKAKEKDLPMARISDHRFNLRYVGFRPGLIRREIKAGTQIVIRDLTSAQVDVIVQQYEIYGMRDAKQMSRLKGYVGFSYSIGSPVPIETMLAVFETNDKAMDEQARERIVVEAADVSNIIAKDLAQKTGKAIEAVRPNVEVVNTEEDSDSAKPINIGVEAPRDRKPRRARAA